MLKILLATALVVSTGTAMGQTGKTVRIGLQDDVGSIDPARSSQFEDRIVLNALCDSLVDIGPDLKPGPKLAISWSQSADNKTLTFKLRQGVKFQDGEPFDAAAVKANIDRALSLPESSRRNELSSVDHVDVIDEYTVAFVLRTPDAALLTMLTDRAGMMLAPKTFASANTHPVCAGPYKFVQRVQNDRIVLEKFPGYWDASKYPIQNVVFQPMPDSTVRLANLRSGSLDMIDRVSPSDVSSIKLDKGLNLVVVGGLGYYSILFNINNGAAVPKALKDKRVRQAFDYAIDRTAISQVIGSGIFAPANQALAPSSPYYDAAIKTPERDVARAKALLKAAGYEHLDLELAFGNNTASNQMAQMLQAMLSEVGINLKLRPTDYATANDVGRKGDFQVFYTGWSGRADPDGNLSIFVNCTGSLNYGHYCNPEIDKQLQEARMKPTPAERKPIYDAMQKTLADEDPQVYIYYQPWLFALSKKVKGFTPHPDGLMRLRGVSVAD